MNILTNTLIQETLEKASQSPRRRAMYCFHKPDESMQRMINALCSDSYIQPHKHENPEKLEIVCILKGKIGVLFFDDEGKITHKVLLEEKGENTSVEIQPGQGHCFFALTPQAAVYEMVRGKYDPKTHKTFASWAPSEGSDEAKVYLEGLKQHF